MSTNNGTSGSSYEFSHKRIPTQPVQSVSISTPQNVQVNVKNPIPVGWLVISRDKETNAGVKMALYNKLPNKFQQLCIKWLFGWWIEEEPQEIKK